MPMYKQINDDTLILSPTILIIDSSNFDDLPSVWTVNDLDNNHNFYPFYNFSDVVQTRTDNGRLLFDVAQGVTTYISIFTNSQIAGKTYYYEFDLDLGDCHPDSLALWFTGQTYTLLASQDMHYDQIQHVLLSYTVPQDEDGNNIMGFTFWSSQQCVDYLDNFKVWYNDTSGTHTECVVEARNGEYRFGFNGIEKDNEYAGIGNHYNYPAREYDPRIIQWWTPDPHARKYPSLSPYSAFANNPILFIDPDGKGAEISNIQVSGNTGTATMTFYMNLYIDPNLNYQGDPASDLTSQLGARGADGTWSYSAGSGVLNTMGANGKVELKAEVKVVVRLITAEEAQTKIATADPKEGQSENYYRVIDQKIGAGGHNLDGSNQGAIRESLNSSDIKGVLTHELWHGVANGYPEDKAVGNYLGYSPKNPTATYGFHNPNRNSVVSPFLGTTLLQSDFDAIKTNEPVSNPNIRNIGNQFPARGVTNGSSHIIGGGVNTNSNLSNEQLQGGKGE